MAKSPRVTRPRLSLALVVAAVLAVPFAGGSPAAAATPGSNTLTITAGEYTYELSGRPKAGWVEVEFDNRGIEYHMAGLVRLKKNVNAKQLQKALLSEEEDAGDELVAGDGGEVAPWPGLLGPRQKMAMLVRLPAGRYGVFCFVPDPHGDTHVAHGMVKVFDVSKGRSSLRPPKDGVVDVMLTDTTVTVPGDSLPRRGYARVTNDGTTARNWNVAKLAQGVAVQEADGYFDQLFESDFQETADGEPPAVLVGGLWQLPAGASAYLVLDLSSGTYGYSNESAEGDVAVDALLGTFTVR